MRGVALSQQRRQHASELPMVERVASACVRARLDVARLLARVAQRALDLIDRHARPVDIECRTSAATRARDLDVGQPRDERGELVDIERVGVLGERALSTKLPPIAATLRSSTRSRLMSLRRKRSIGRKECSRIQRSSFASTSCAMSSSESAFASTRELRRRGVPGPAAAAAAASSVDCSGVGGALSTASADAPAAKVTAALEAIGVTLIGSASTRARRAQSHRPGDARGAQAGAMGPRGRRPVEADKQLIRSRSASQRCAISGM